MVSSAACSANKTRQKENGNTRPGATYCPRLCCGECWPAGFALGCSLGLGVTAAPGPGLCWMHTCTALAALLHRAPCHVRRQQQGYTLFLASYTRSLSIKCGAVLVKLPPGWASGWVPARQTDRCWRARSTTKCGRVSATLATRAWRV